MRPIDADALKELIDGGFDIDFDEVPETKKALLNMIDYLPTANVVERKRGKWIRHSIGHENTPWGFDCSACGKWFVISEDSAEKYRYCPNCGAEMKGEEDD